MRRASIVAVAALVSGFAAGPEDALKKINVAALDRQGQPVPGLQGSDFQLQEDGKARNIAFVHFTGDQALQARKPGETQPPGEYSNRPGAASRVTVILVDLLSDRAMTGSIVGDDIMRALKNLESSDGLYLYFLTTSGELYPVHPLPKPGANLPPAGEPWTKNIGPMMQTALKTLVGLKPVDDRDTKVRFDLTVRGLRELGGQMQFIAGRKNLVWVTHGVPLNGASISEHGIVDFTNPLRVLCEQLERVQIVVYPVEQTLSGVPAIGTEGGQTLDEVSSLTGGKKFPSGEVAEAIRAANTDSRANYEIAYYTPAVNADGKHHKLKLTCSHKDVRLQMEPGFYWLLGVPKPTDVERGAFQIAIASPFDATEIGLRASAAPDAASGKMRFEIRIDPADLMLRQTQDHRSGKVALLFAEYEDAGVKEPDNPMAMQLNLTAEQYSAALHDGIVLNRDVAVGPGVRKVRVIVVDEDLGSAGSVTVPIVH